MKTHKRKEFLDELRRMPIIHSACEKAGISRQTYYRWVEVNPDFKKEVGIAMSEGADKVDDISNSQLFKALNDGELRAIFYWNEKHSDRVHKTANRLQGKSDNLSAEEVIKIATKNVLEELQIGNVKDSKYVLENNDPKYYSSTKARLRSEHDLIDEKERKKIASDDLIKEMERMMMRFADCRDDEDVKET
jgi:hypothetical protein